MEALNRITCTYRQRRLTLSGLLSCRYSIGRFTPLRKDQGHFANSSLERICQRVCASGYMSSEKKDSRIPDLFVKRAAMKRLINVRRDVPFIPDGHFAGNEMISHAATDMNVSCSTHDDAVSKETTSGSVVVVRKISEPSSSPKAIAPAVPKLSRVGANGNGGGGAAATGGGGAGDRRSNSVVPPAVVDNATAAASGPKRRRKASSSQLKNTPPSCSVFAFVLIIQFSEQRGRVTKKRPYLKQRKFASYLRKPHKMDTPQSIPIHDICGITRTVVVDLLDWASCVSSLFKCEPAARDQSEVVGGSVIRDGCLYGSHSEMNERYPHFDDAITDKCREAVRRLSVYPAKDAMSRTYSASFVFASLSTIEAFVTHGSAHNHPLNVLLPEGRVSPAAARWTFIACALQLRYALIASFAAKWQIYLEKRKRTVNPGLPRPHCLTVSRFFTRFAANSRFSSRICLPPCFVVTVFIIRGLLSATSLPTFDYRERYYVVLGNNFSGLQLLSPGYKRRSEELKRLFKGVSEDEKLVIDYSCAYQKEILLHGRMYVSQNWLCFYSNIFRWETTLAIPFKDIVAIKKEKTAKIIPNAILVSTSANEKLFFTSFSARDKAYMMIFKLWQYALLDQVLKRDVKSNAV
ncbi:unnamed protein product [Soboliphyme baturini]|uniref:GRAM domain-containing protein n=1 Tax=Soboliphyme baturini TaxID=241478 RepID=A0A183IM84_9BILA|nr:unnamed protein product [Soboliphyme baturini]